MSNTTNFALQDKVAGGSTSYTQCLIQHRSNIPNRLTILILVTHIEDTLKVVASSQFGPHSRAILNMRTHQYLPSLKNKRLTLFHYLFIMILSSRQKENPL